MQYLVNSMAQAEVNVARFYYVRKAYIAAIDRAQVVLRDFQRTPAVEEALAIIVRSYDGLGMKDLQADAERVLLANFPDSKYRTGPSK
jgi:outer membrane protein assembly factor BamD